MGFSWGGSTNIEAAFDIILDIALENKLTKVEYFYTLPTTLIFI